MKTTIPCPCCDVPLHFETPQLFCGNTPCHSLSANDGVELPNTHIEEFKSEPDTFSPEIVNGIERLTRRVREEMEVA